MQKDHELSSKAKNPQTKNYLSTAQIAAIENALGRVGEFGEVHLIVQKGRLRFLVTQKSIDLLNHSNNNHQD